MPKEEIITGLDLGSKTIRVVVGQRGASHQELQIIGVAEQPSEGISRGVVTGIEEAVSSISSALEKAERMCGTPIEQAYVGIGGAHITAQESQGVVAVSKADGEIKEEDVERVIEAAQAVATPPNYEILHVIPRSFAVDGQKGIKDPVGMTGIRLEVVAQVIQGLSTQVKTLTKCIYRTGLDINDLVLGVLASAESVLSRRQKELGVALANIGDSTTSLAVFEEGDVIHTVVLPVGGAHITNDIAIGLRTSIDTAEQVKLEYGTALPDSLGKRDEIDLGELGASESERVSRRYIAQITEARVEEIFTMANKELQKINRAGLLPAGVVLTGGGAKLPGIVDVAKRIFKLPASVGLPQELTSAIDKMSDPTFTTAVGLVMWGAFLTDKERGFAPNFSSMKRMTGKMTRWVRSLLP